MRRHLRLEALESRQLLAITTNVEVTPGGDLVITDIEPGGRNDTITLSRSGANVRIASPGAELAALNGAIQVSTTVVDVPLANFSGVVQVNTLDGADSLTIDTSAGAPFGAAGFALDGGDGSDTLVGPNAANTWNITGSNSGNLSGGGTFTTVENPVGSANADEFLFSAGQGVTGTIDGGGGIDHLNYSAYTTSVSVNLGLNVTNLQASMDSAQEVPPR